MLKEIKKSFLKQALFLGDDIVNQSATFLADNYLDETDRFKKESYFAALMIKYWGSISINYQKSKASGFKVEDCYDWLTHAVLYVLQNKVWRNKNHKLYGDPKAVDKAISMAITGSRDIAYDRSNKAVRKVNYGAMSLEERQEEVGENSYLFESDHSYAKVHTKELELASLLEYYCKKGNELWAIVVKAICTEECFTSAKTGSNFKISKVVNALLAFKGEDKEEWVIKYKANEDKMREIYEFFKAATSFKVKKLVEKCISLLAKDKALLEYLAV